MSIIVRQATPDDAVQTSSIINQAFIEGDSFFKKPEYLKRLDDDGKEFNQILLTPNQTFLVYENENQIKGAIKLEWTESEGFLGMLSVPQKFGKQGIGKNLIKQSEQFILDKIKKPYLMKLPIISLRTDLLSYYESQQYQKQGELAPFTGYEHVVAEGFDVKLQWMQKLIQ